MRFRNFLAGMVVVGLGAVAAWVGNELRTAETTQLASAADPRIGANGPDVTGLDVGR